MKKLIVALMTSAFLAATTGLAMADNATPSASPAKKEMKVKKSRKHHHSKKMGKKEAAQATPAASGTK